MIDPMFMPQTIFEWAMAVVGLGFAIPCWLALLY